MVKLAQLTLFVCLIYCPFSSDAQGARTFNVAGSWSTNGNWQGGVPNNTKNARITASPCNVDVIAECLDLTLSSASIFIQSGQSLTVNRNFFLEPISSITNNGTLIILGDYFVDVTRKLEINGGLEFGNGSTAEFPILLGQ